MHPNFFFKYIWKKILPVYTANKLLKSTFGKCYMGCSFSRTDFFLHLFQIFWELCTTWQSKTRVTSCELRFQIYELRVQIYELRVQIYELLVQIHGLPVQIYELQVQMYEF